MSKILEYNERYYAAMHAVQSGVRACIENNVDESHSPKHLRVGCNSALMETGMLASLLIEKKVITEEEYYKMLAEMAEREKEKYEQTLSKFFGKTVTLI